MKDIHKLAAIMWWGRGGLTQTSKYIYSTVKIPKHSLTEVHFVCHVQKTPFEFGGYIKYLGHYIFFVISLKIFAHIILKPAYYEPWIWFVLSVEK